jgi:hypothetical protein
VASWTRRISAAVGATSCSIGYPVGWPRWGEPCVSTPA